MDHSAFLVWWLLGTPVVLAIVDVVKIANSIGMRSSVADGYIARLDGRPAASTAGAATIVPV